MSPRQALPLRFEFALLGLVRRAPVHGYELLQKLSTPNGLSEIWRIKIGQVYAFLNKLEDQGYLTSTRQPQSDYPARRLYAITPAGETAFLAWMRTPVTTARDLRQLFLLKLYFEEDVPRTVIAKLLSDQIDLCRGWLESLEQERASAIGWKQRVAGFRTEMVRASLHWLESIQPKWILKEKTR